MKTINLSALSQFALDDIESLVSRLENIPSGGISLEQMKNNPSVRTSKIGPILKVLVPFGLITQKQDRYALTAAGKDFSRSGAVVKKAVMRNLFMTVEPIQRLVELLMSSSTVRLPVKVVHESFNLDSRSNAADAEILGFILWAQACDLFSFDKKAKEIFRSEYENLKGPVEAAKTNANAFTLSMTP